MWPWLPERVVVVHIPCVLCDSGVGLRQSSGMSSGSGVGGKKKTRSDAAASLSKRDRTGFLLGAFFLLGACR